MDSFVIAGWVLIGITWALIVPYIGYWCYIYIYYKRSKLYFKKRKPLLIDILIGLVASGILIENQSLVFLTIFSLDGDDVIAAECVRFFNTSTLIAMYMVIMIRIYLLYFQANYNEATISKKWREFVHEEQDDFFLSNIHTYGNDKFLIRLASIVWLCFCAIYIVLESFSPLQNMSQWFIFVLFIALFVFAAYMLRKFPDFHDTLHIRTELQYFVALNFIILLAWTVLLAIGQGVSTGIARYYWQATMYLVIFWISINRVIHWNEIQRKEIMDLKDKNSVYYLAMTDRAFNIQHVLATQKGYEEFMKFLVSEFSTENLLFVTEYMQLKNLLCLSDKEMRSLKVTLSVDLPDTLPLPKMIQDLNLDIEQIRHVQRERKEQLKLRKKKLEKLNAAENLERSQEMTADKQRAEAVSPTQSSLPDVDDSFETKSRVFSPSLVSTTVTAFLHQNMSASRASADGDDLYDANIRNTIEEEEEQQQQQEQEADDAHMPAMLNVQSAPVQTASVLAGNANSRTRKDSWVNVASQTRDADDEDEDCEDNNANGAEAGNTNRTQTATEKTNTEEIKEEEKDDDKRNSMRVKALQFAKDDISVRTEPLTPTVPTLVGAKSLTQQRSKSKKSTTSSMRLQILKKTKTVAAEMRYQIREASNSIGLGKRNQMLSAIDCKAFSNICVKLYYKYIATHVAPLEVNVSSATRGRCVHTFQSNVLSRKSSLSRSQPRQRGLSGNALSKGVADLLTSKRDIRMRMDALEVLREVGVTESTTMKEGTTFSSRSKRKLELNNTEEPFDGNIVVAMGELLPPLEQCAVEINSLLQDSFQRFRKTKTCCKLYEEYASRQ